MAAEGGPIRQLQVQMRALTRLAQDTGGASGFHGRLDWPSPKVGGLSTEPRSTQSGAGSASRSQWLPAKCPKPKQRERHAHQKCCSVSARHTVHDHAVPIPQSAGNDAKDLAPVAPKNTTSSRAPCRVTPFLASGAWPKAETCKATCP